MPFPDDNSFRKYGLRKGYSEAQRNDWRRENVNTLIRELKRTILLTKPWVRFGISPFGIYRNKKSTADGSGSNTNGLQNYDDLYADITYWVQQGWIDYNIPRSIGRSDTRRRITSRLSNGGTKTPTEVIYISGKTWPAP